MALPFMTATPFVSFDPSEAEEEEETAAVGRAKLYEGPAGSPVRLYEAKPFGTPHSRDANWQSRNINNWTEDIKLYILQNIHTFSNPLAVRKDYPTIQVQTTENQIIPINLEDYKLIFQRRDLQRFAGHTRLGDSMIPIDKNMRAWVQYWSAMIGGGLAGISLVSSGPLKQWDVNIKSIATINEQITRAIGRMTEAKNFIEQSQSILQNQTATAAAIRAGKVYEGLNLLTVQQSINATQAGIATANSTALAAGREVETGRTAIETILSSRDWVQTTIMDNLPSGFYSVAQSIGDNLVWFARPFVDMGAVGAAAVVVGGLTLFAALVLEYYWARDANKKLVTEETIKSIESLAKEIAKQTMANELKTHREINEDVYRRAAQQLQRQQQMVNREMRDMMKKRMETEASEKILRDEAALNAIIREYEHRNVNAWDLLVYIALKMKNLEVSEQAGKAVLQHFGNAAGFFGSDGPLIRYLKEDKSRCTQPSATPEDVKECDKKLRIANYLREKNWSFQAISSVDWDPWITDELTRGIIPTIDSIVINFRKTTPEHRLDISEPLLPYTEAKSTQQDRPAFTSLAPDTVVPNGQLEEVFDDDSKKCIVLDYIRNVVDRNPKQDMWTEHDIPPEQRPNIVTYGYDTRNFERGMSILLKLLDDTKWSKNTKEQDAGTIKFNSYQALWLYRWMGPACSRWLSPTEDYKKGPIHEIKTIPANSIYPERKLPIYTAAAHTVSFFTDLCRMRFAFLKSMLVHSVLFLFVRKEKALGILRKKYDSRNAGELCIVDVLEKLRLTSDTVGNGYGMLLLDNCRPGHIRIVGFREDGTEVNEATDATQFVQLVTNDKHPEQWTFNHLRILVNIVKFALKKGIKLLSNMCWKSYRTNPQSNNLSSYEQKQMLNVLKLAPVSDDVSLEERKVIDFQTALYLYKQSNNAALLSYVRRGKKELSELIEKTNIHFYTDKIDTVDDVKNVQTRIGKIYQRLEERSTSAKALMKGRSYGGTLANANPDLRPEGQNNKLEIDPFFIKQNEMDKSFRKAAIDYNIFDEKYLNDIEAQTRIIVNDDKAWEILFENSEYKGCQPQPVLMINTLCVNPFAICVYEKKREPDGEPTRLFRIFGDLWFLQPMLEQFYRISKFGYSIKRFTPVQQLYADDIRRTYLQDILYFCEWNSFILGQPQDSESLKRKAEENAESELRRKARIEQEIRDMAEAEKEEKMEQVYEVSVKQVPQKKRPFG